jgi:hypothetical protein
VRQGASAAPRRLLVSSDALKAGEAGDMSGGVANPVYLAGGPSAAPSAAATAATPSPAPMVVVAAAPVAAAAVAPMPSAGPRVTAAQAQAAMAAMSGGGTPTDAVSG